MISEGVRPDKPSETLPEFLSRLRAFDALNILYLLFLSVLVTCLAPRIPLWSLLVGANLAGILVICAITCPMGASGNSTRRFFRDWYTAPLIFIVFKEIYVIIQSLARNDFDLLLIDIDRKLFGCDPTIWFSRYTSPYLTELLQLAYASYFIIMITVGYQLYRGKDRNEYLNYIFALMLGFYISYIGYLLVPAIGPRFTLHEFSTLDRELPGIFLAISIRDFLNAAESIPKNVPDAWKYAQRDVFPSGHTAMTLISLFFAAKYRIKSRWYLYIAGGLLLIATVYLRYHYVIDLLGGILTMILVVWVAPKIMRWWDIMRSAIK